jgi:hypothetical protein
MEIMDEDVKVQRITDVMQDHLSLTSQGTDGPGSLEHYAEGHIADGPFTLAIDSDHLPTVSAQGMVPDSKRMHWSMTLQDLKCAELSDGRLYQGTLESDALQILRVLK